MRRKALKNTEKSFFTTKYYADIVVGNTKRKKNKAVIKKQIAKYIEM